MTKNQNKNEDFSEEFSEEINDTDFIESYSSKKRRREKENVVDLTYLNEEVKDVFIYSLTTLTGKSISEGIRISKEKTMIMCTLPNLGQKVRVYLEQNENYNLSEFSDPENPTEQLIKNSNSFNILTKDFEKIDFDLLYLLTFEEINTENIDNLKQYIGQIISKNIDDDEMEMTFVPIEEFSSLFKSRPIKIILSQPIEEPVDKIDIWTPGGTLVSSIKVIDENGYHPNLTADENTEIFPKIVFPFQTTPNLNTAEYWASKQIIPFKEIFDFLDSKGINYDQEFSLQEFLKLGEDIEYPSVHFDNVSKIRFKIDKMKYSYSNDGTLPDWKTDTLSKFFEFEKDKVTNFLTVEFGSNTANLTQPDEIKGSNFAFARRLTVLENITNVDVFEIETQKNSSAFTAICQMLTESFWKDMEFEGSTKVEIKDGQEILQIDDKDIYLLQEKYSGQDRYSVTSNVWISWKRKNPDLVNKNPEIIKRIENSLAMLSGVIKSNHSINKGDNDDYKILLPYYFEIQNKLNNPSSWTSYSDIIVKLKSNYGIFLKDKFLFDYDEISSPRIFELENNYFVFPELTKKVETASIPSSMPLDQELANGEYSKYLMKNFTYEENVKKELLKKYGSGKMEKNTWPDPLIKNKGLFNIEKMINISEIEISSFYGYGEWFIQLINSENNRSVAFTINLFDKYNNSQTLVNLIL